MREYENMPSMETLAAMKGDDVEINKGTRSKARVVAPVKTYSDLQAAQHKLSPGRLVNKAFANLR